MDDQAQLGRLTSTDGAGGGMIVCTECHDLGWTSRMYRDGLKHRIKAVSDRVEVLVYSYARHVVASPRRKVCHNFPGGISMREPSKYNINIL